MRETALAARARPRPSTDVADAWRIVRGYFAAGNELASFREFCARLVWITTKANDGKPVRLVWNRSQERFMQNRTGRDIVLKGRQLGLTTLEIARSIWFAAMRPNVAVITIAQPHKQNKYSQQVATVLRFMLREMESELHPHWSGFTVTFGNGSSIFVTDAGGSVETAEKASRGGTYHRAHSTETAFYPYGEHLFTGLLNTLPASAEYVEESTANGVDGAFYKHCAEARSGEIGYHFHFVPWWDGGEYRLGTDESPAVAANPEELEVVEAATREGRALTASQLAWWRAKRAVHGFDKCRQEFPHTPESAFLNTGSCYFDAAGLRKGAELIRAPLSVAEIQAAALVESKARPFVEKLAKLAERLGRGLGTGLRVYDVPRAGSYLIAVDTAGGGKEGNHLAALVFGRSDPAHPHVATLQMRVDPAEFARLVGELGYAFGTALVVVERNFSGTVLHVLHEELNYPALWKKDPSELSAEKMGWTTTAGNRMVIIDGLADAIVQGEFRSPDAKLWQEAGVFVRTDSGKVEAAPGETDDLVMAAAIGWRVLTAPQPTTERGVKRAGAIAPFG